MCSFFNPPNIGEAKKCQNIFKIVADAKTLKVKKTGGSKKISLCVLRHLKSSGHLVPPHEHD